MNEILDTDPQVVSHDVYLAARKVIAVLTPLSFDMNDEQRAAIFALDAVLQNSVSVDVLS